MRIEIPVYVNDGAKVVLQNRGAYVKDKAGLTVWSYNNDDITGKRIFICACARSGTKYITDVLRELGYDIGHEVAKKDGSVGYHLAVIKPENCFHQVRHPLDQIASMGTQSHWGFMAEVITVDNHDLLGCMQYWLKWNELCEEFCTWRYRLEDLPWVEFLERIGHKYEEIPDVPTNVNSRQHGNLTWDDLFSENKGLAQKIYDKTVGYGYSFPKGQNETIESQVAVTV